MKVFANLTLAAILLAGCHANKATTHTGSAAGDAAAEKKLEGTYWILTELQGKPVKPPEPGEKPSFIYLDSAKKHASVSGGCNVMGGGYELKDGNRIKFGQMISTMMACPDMTNEEGLKRMTGLVDNYAIQGDSLSFSKARMAPMARFKAAPVPEGFKLN